MISINPKFSYDVSECCKNNYLILIISIIYYSLESISILPLFIYFELLYYFYLDSNILYFPEKQSSNFQLF